MIIAFSMALAGITYEPSRVPILEPLALISQNYICQGATSVPIYSSLFTLIKSILK